MNRKNSKISPNILISREFSNHTMAGLSDTINGSTLKYYIHLEEGDITLEDGSRAHSIGNSDIDVAFVDNIFQTLDPLIELDFEKQYDWNDTLLDIYSIDWHSQWDDETVGEVFDQGLYEYSYWDVLWRDTDDKGVLSEFDASTIIHEIGHALGLSHPNEDPYNQNWDTTDTVMSYNEGSNGWDTWFSSADIKALQLIWGEESGLDLYPGQTDSHNNQIEDIRRSYIGTKDSDEITGSNNNDKIKSLAGNDFIFARGGDDIIRTGKGEDFAWGGDGSDIFIVKPKIIKGSKNIDYLMDFQAGIDEIRIKGSTQRYTIDTYEDSSFISKGSKIIAWIDGAIGLSWTSENSIS